jgi:hypothetical protein
LIHGSATSQQNVGSINSRIEKDWENDASLRQKPWHFPRRDTTMIAFRQQATNIRYIYNCTNNMPVQTHELKIW